MTAASTPRPAIPASSSRLAVEDLCVERGGRRVLDGLSFALTEGEALVVTGRNGAGKSTLLRALAGLLPKARGRVRFEGLEDAEIATRLHYLGHADGLKTALTARENLAFWARYLDGFEEAPARAVAKALERVGLARIGDAPVAMLSAGQKRRAALARLLVAKRPLWLLDEPASALDAIAREQLARLMAEHRAEGGLVIAATHDDLALSNARELKLGGVE